MRPIFSIHAGEYLVGNYLEAKYKKIRLWIPSKDTDLDLLITSADCQHSISLQVKFSKDHAEKEKDKEIHSKIKSLGWWTLNRNSIKNSIADYWIMVLYRVQISSHDYVVIPPENLLAIYDNLDRKNETIHSYLWVTDTKPNRCWETRDLKKQDKRKISQDQYKNKFRDLSFYLNNWTSVEELNK
jgi:hypothetical protein